MENQGWSKIQIKLIHLKASPHNIVKIFIQILIKKALILTEIKLKK